MEKLKLFFTMLMLIAFSVGNVWAAETVYTGTVAKVDANGDQVMSDVTWTITSDNAAGLGQAVNNTKGAQIGSGSKPSKSLTFETTGITGTIKKVVVNTSGASGFSGTVSVTVGSTAFKCNSSETANLSTTATDYTFVGGASGKITISWAQTTSKAIYVKTIQVTYESEESGDDVTVKTLKSIALSGQTTSFYQNAAFAFDGTCTATYSVTKNDVAQADEQKVVTPTSVSSPDMTTLGDKEVTVTFTDGEVSKEAKYTVTVTEAPAAVNYELVTNANDLADAAEIIIVNIDEDKAISTTQASSNRTATAVSSTSHVIAAGDDVQVITLEASSSNWKLSVGEDSYLYASSNSSNQLKTAKATTAGDNGVWAITIANDGAATVIAQGTNGRNNMRYNPNNGSAMFSCYASTSDLGLVKIFKKVDGTVKPSAELSYATADQKKLTKLGDAFTAPELSNPHSVAVSYASNNTDVAEVASNGAVTIKAAGVAVITASFAGNDDYKAGSASYTIGVTTHAGTEADPFVAADVKIVVDAVETLENAYATGIVSNVVTTTLPTEGYITFYFSADGLTSGQQVEAFKCYGLNSAQFEAVTDVVTGATVVITGTLKKYNSIYEFDANCHLVSYTAPAAPKQSIANYQANPYTVAQAIAYAADGVTYDLDDYVYVQGVVYDVKSFNNGAMNIFIKDANAENQFELFKCAGINDGNSTTPFEALTDVQAGNVVIGYGQLSYYDPYYEFKQGNYLVDLQKPVTGVELDATAEVEAGSTVNLPATILPSNATGTIVWSVESGDDYASVENGVVTGIAEGEAVIRATVQGTEIYAECTVTVSAAAPVLTDYYEKVTETAGIVEGTYLIVYEEGSLAFNGGLTTLDAESNTIAVDITADSKIGVTEQTAAATFYIDKEAGTIQSKSGKYIGVSSNSNGLKTSNVASTYTNAFEIDDDGNAVISAVFEGSTMTMRYNKGSGQERFRYFGSGQQAIQLYKLANEVVKASPELAWSSESVELTVGAEFTSPTLSHADGITGAITYESDKETVATVDENGVISLVAEATGTAHITASYAGNENFKAGSAVCTIKVNPAHSIYVSPSLTVDFGSVTKDATVEDKVITVTLTGVDAATATPSGDGASAFSISTEKLTESGDITISASSVTVGTFNATLTISDDASEAADKVVILKLTVTEPEIIDDLSGSWVLATAVPAVGQKFIIAGTYQGTTKTVGEQRQNNRAAVASTLEDDVLTPGAGTKVFTLVDAGDGKFAIQASNGKYLYAAGESSNNYLKEADDYEAVEAKWNITIENGVASVISMSEGDRNALRYNSTSNSELFSCYKSTSQRDIALYVQDTYTRTLEPNRYYTVCLPKKMMEVRGASFWKIENRDNAGTMVYLEEVDPTTAEAGTPFIIQATDTKLEVVYTGAATTTAGTNGALHGTLTYMDADALAAAGSNIYMLYQNKLRPVGTNNHLDANRAYINYNELNPVTEAPQPAPGRRVKAMPMQTNTATGMDELNASETPVKMMIDGQLFILRGEKMYNANGQLVK